MTIKLSKRVNELIVLLFVFGTHPSFAQITKQPANKRWVIGSGVNLREQANLSAPVLMRMALNTPVNLIAEVPKSKYCEIEVLASDKEALRGFTACEFLGANVIKPREIASLYLADGKTPNPNYNPERSFWLKPSYEALAEYGRYLENKRNYPKDEAEGVFLSERPKIAEFERMKAHLAKGILVARPEPFLRWDDLKISVRNLQKERLKKIKRIGPIEKAEYSAYFGTSLEKRTNNLMEIIGINTLDGLQGRAGLDIPPKLFSFIESLELPVITSSYFQDQNDIAAPTTHTEKVAARFQIIQAIQTKSYESRPKENKREWFGLWDISLVNRSLTQQVVKNTLSKNGSNIQSEATYIRQSVLEYGNDDGVMCEGYEGDGFDFGDADPKISINYGLNSGHPDYSQPQKTGNKLMYFFTKRPLPQQTVSLNITKQKLNRAATGFVSSTAFHFDLNSDGIPDLVVWEGVGISPGHLDGPTKTDDAWFRAFFVNIAGHWHLLGKDTFSYGCGC